MGQRDSMQLEGQRGQTMPFWVIGVLIALSAMFFLSNYVNAVVWQIRAQNAADSAASTSLSITANLWNEETTILYSAALDEYRIRYLNQALLNTIEGVGCNAATCATDYTSLRNELSAAVGGYDADIQLLRQGNNFTEGGQQADQKKADKLVGSDCSNANDYTCSFVFTETATASTGSTGNGKKGGGGGDVGEAEYVACRQIPYFGSALLNLGNAGTYKVIGRGAAAVIPASTEAFNPGTQTNPNTGAAYQPVEHWAAAQFGVANDVNFAGFTANLNWYAAGTIKPFGGTLTSNGFSC